MDKIIAFCGINCAECLAFIAHKNDDNQLRVKTAEQWSKEFKTEMKPEDINCVGCTPLEGPHIGHCGVCEIRKCGLEKGVATCAHCDDYACEKLAKFFEMVPAAKATLDEIRKNL